MAAMGGSEMAWGLVMALWLAGMGVGSRLGVRFGIVSIRDRRSRRHPRPRGIGALLFRAAPAHPRRGARRDHHHLARGLAVGARRRPRRRRRRPRLSDPRRRARSARPRPGLHPRGRSARCSAGSMLSLALTDPGNGRHASRRLRCGRRRDPVAAPTRPRVAARRSAARRPPCPRARSSPAPRGSGPATPEPSATGPKPASNDSRPPPARPLTLYADGRLVGELPRPLDHPAPGPSDAAAPPRAAPRPRRRLHRRRQRRGHDSPPRHRAPAGRRGSAARRRLSDWYGRRLPAILMSSPQVTIRATDPLRAIRDTAISIW